MSAATATSTRPRSRPARVLRFDLVQRSAHWANALLFGILMLTALPLYFGSIGAAVGRRGLVEAIHLWAGIALPVPLVVSLIGQWGRRMRRDARRINYWTRDELRWLRRLGGRRAPAVRDKFNPGQKLNAIFVGGAIVVMLVTGCILKWFSPFPLSWRSGSTFTHDVVALAVFVVVFGHVGFALTHPPALRSMITGWVDERWAAEHSPDWLAETRAERRPRGGRPR